MARNDISVKTQVHKLINELGIHQSDKIKITQAMFNKPYVAQLSIPQCQQLLAHLQEARAYAPAQPVEYLLNSVGTK